MKYFILIVIILIGALLRFTAVNWDSYQAFHPDERNIAWAVTRIHFFDQMNPNFFAYGGLPIYLYRALGELVVVATGNTTWLFDWGHIAVLGRYVSATLSSISIILIYLVTKSYFSKVTGILSAFFLAFSPWAIREAHFATTETMLVFFLLLLLFLSHCLLQYTSDVKASHTSEVLRILEAIGLILGLALAAKTTSVLFALIPVAGLVSQLTFFQRPLKKSQSTHSTPRSKDRGMLRVDTERRVLLRTKIRSLAPSNVSIRQIILHLLLLTIITGVIFFLFSPYTILDWQRFKESMDYESGVALGRFPVPYTLQFLNTIPYLYQLQTMLWQAGPVAMVGLAGLALLTLTAFKRRNSAHAAFLIFPIVYLLWQGGWFAKFARYNVPLLPFVTIAAAWFLIEPAKRFPRFGYPLLITVSLITLFLGLANWTIYLRPQTRIEASRWIYQNIAADAIIYTEHWNDGLPGTVPGAATKPFNRKLLNVYDDDDDAKLDMYQDTLTKGQYIILSTRRIWATMPKLTKKYPYTSQFYKKLFDGSLGYREVAAFTSYPQLFGVVVSDDSAEESIQVFDHPTVKIFQNITPLSRGEIRSRLTSGQ